MATTHREVHKVAHATARIGTDRYHVDIQAGQHPLCADEPVDHGGADSGPTPFGLLLSGLGACTAITCGCTPTAGTGRWKASMSSSPIGCRTGRLGGSTV